MGVWMLGDPAMQTAKARGSDVGCSPAWATRRGSATSATPRAPSEHRAAMSAHPSFRGEHPTSINQHRSQHPTSINQHRSHTSRHQRRPLRRRQPVVAAGEIARRPFRGVVLHAPEAEAAQLPLDLVRGEIRKPRLPDRSGALGERSACRAASRGRRAARTRTRSRSAPGTRRR